MARLIFIALLACAPAVHGQDARIAPRTMTLSRPEATIGQIAEELKKQTGLSVEVPKELAELKVEANFKDAPYWQVVGTIAARAGCRIAVGGQGREVRLVKLADKAPVTPSAVDGPFRVAVRQIVGKRDFETGDVSYEVLLDLMWEPRFPVFYADSEPEASAAAGKGPGTDPAQNLALQAAPRAKVFTAVTGHTTPMTVRFKNVPRTHNVIQNLDLKVTAIGAEKMLPFVFDLPLGQKAAAASQEKEGVRVTLHPVKQVNRRAELVFDLAYPASHPNLESFQQFASENRLRLVSADGRTKFETTDYNTSESGNKVRATYFFTKDLPENLAGWKVEYETPSPLMELPLKFSLKNIPLP